MKHLLRDVHINFKKKSASKIFPPNAHGLAGQEMPVGWTQRAADCHRAVDLCKRAGNATCFRVVSFRGVVG